jgi:drug/metabolite transporter (DMT)-like permease
MLYSTMRQAAARNGRNALGSAGGQLRLLLVVALGAVAGMFVAGTHPSDQALLVAAIGAVLLAPIAWRVARRRLDPFEPIFLFALSFGAMFVVRPAAILARGDFEYLIPARDGDRAIDITSSFTPMLLVALVGAMVLARRAARGARPPSTLGRAPAWRRVPRP